MNITDLDNIVRETSNFPVKMKSLLDDADYIRGNTRQTILLRPKNAKPYFNELADANLFDGFSKLVSDQSLFDTDDSLVAISSVVHCDMINLRSYNAVSFLVDSQVLPSEQVPSIQHHVSAIQDDDGHWNMTYSGANSELISGNISDKADKFMNNVFNMISSSVDVLRFHKAVKSSSVKGINPTMAYDNFNKACASFIENDRLITGLIKDQQIKRRSPRVDFNTVDDYQDEYDTY